MTLKTGDTTSEQWEKLFTKKEQNIIVNKMYCVWIANATMPITKVKKVIKYALESNSTAIIKELLNKNIKNTASPNTQNCDIILAMPFTM